MLYPLSYGRILRDAVPFKNSYNANDAGFFLPQAKNCLHTPPSIVGDHESGAKAMAAFAAWADHHETNDGSWRHINCVALETLPAKTRCRAVPSTATRRSC